MEKHGYYLHDDPSIPRTFLPCFTHEYLTYFSVLPSPIMNRPEVKVQPNPRFGDWEVGPKHEDVYIEGGVKKRELDPFETFDCMEKNGDFPRDPPDATVAPWSILLYYCTEPDRNLDCDLNLHWTQKLTKGSHALRHMQFSYLGLPIGQLVKTFWYHVDAAGRAGKKGNEYWKWRFLARALHYLQDLGHPFHAKVAPTKEMLFGFFKKGFFKRLSAAHNSYEVYTQYKFRQEDRRFKEALIQGSKEGLQSDIGFKKALKSYKKHAMNQLSPIYNTLLDTFGDELVAIYDVMDQYKDEDPAKQTLMAESNTQALIFKDEDHPALEYLEEITTSLIERVGFITGLFLQHYLNNRV